MAQPLSHRTEPALKRQYPLTFINLTTWAEAVELGLLKSAHHVPNVNLVQAGSVDLYNTGREKNLAGLK